MATTAHANGSHLVDGTVANAYLNYQKQTLLNLNLLNKRKLVTALIAITIEIQ